MSSEESPVPSVAGESSQFHDDLFTPLTTISTRMELLQRITMVTPGLTELERTVLLEGLAAAQAAALQLESQLEALIAGKMLSNASALPVPDPASVPLTLSESPVDPGSGLTEYLATDISPYGCSESCG